MTVGQLPWKQEEDGLLNRRSPVPQVLGIDIFSLVFGKNPLVTPTPTNPVTTPAINTSTDNGQKPPPTNTQVPQTPTVPATQAIVTSNTRAPVILTTGNPSPGTSTVLNAAVASPNPNPGTSTAPNGDVVSSNPNPGTSTTPNGDVVSSNPTPGPLTTASGDVTSSNPTPGPLTAASGDVTSSNPTPGPLTAASGDVTSSNPTPGPLTAVSFTASTSTALSSTSGISDALNPNASATPFSDNTPTAYAVYSPLSSSPFASTGSGSGLVSGSPRPTDTSSGNNERSRDLNIAALVGGLIGAVVGIALLVFVLVVFVRRRRARQEGDMDDSAALLGASKRRGTAARPLSPSSLSINSVESQTRPVSFSTQYGLTYNAESNGHPDVHVIGRPSTSLSQQVERLKTSLSQDGHSKPSTHTVPQRASSSGSDSVLQHAAEVDIPEMWRSMERLAGDKGATSTGRMSFIPVLPETSVRMGLSVVPGSPLTPTSEDPLPVAGPTTVSAESSNDNDSFYRRLSSISRITTKSLGSLYSEEGAQGGA